MLTLKTLYIKDFLSFEEETIELQNGVTTCIMGRNLTEDSQESNGSGKSAIQSAIEFSLTGNVSRKVTKGKLIRRGQKEAVVSLTLFNSFKNETLEISRTIPSKGSEKINISINKKEVEIATTKDANDWIINYIGVSKEDISNYFIPNEVSYTSFFNSSDTAKKELISRFSNADIVDNVFCKVQADIDSKEEVIKSNQRELNKLEGRLIQLNEDLKTELQVDFKKQKSDLIQSIKEKEENSRKAIAENSKKLADMACSISHLKDNIIEGRKATLNAFKSHLERYLSTSKDYESEYNKLNEEFDKLNIKESKIENAEKGIKLDISDIDEDFSKMEVIISGKIECPNCKYQFNPKSEITIEEANKNIEELKEELKGFKEELEKVRSLKENLYSQKEEVRTKSNSLSKEQIKFNKGKSRIEKIVNLIGDSIKRFVRNIDSYQLEFNEIKENSSYHEAMIEKYKKQIKEVESSERDNSKEFQIKNNIKEVSKSVEEVNKQIEILTKEQENIKEWLFNFKLFKSYLANKKLKIIQDMINKYLQDMKCDYKLKLEGYKTLANGKDIREKITPYIYTDGELCDYGEFSKGERTRIDFATLLTLQTLVNDNTENPLDILFVDEITEGLDSQGLSDLLKSINETKKTCYLTTHVVNESIYNNILMIEKVNGISKISKN